MKTWSLTNDKQSLSKDSVSRSQNTIIRKTRFSNKFSFERKSYYRVNNEVFHFDKQCLLLSEKQFFKVLTKYLFVEKKTEFFDKLDFSNARLVPMLQSSMHSNERLNENFIYFIYFFLLRKRRHWPRDFKWSVFLTWIFLGNDGVVIVAHSD